MVFQNYALYPHMTVAQNMGFALKVAKTPKPEIRERVLAAAKLLDLQPYLDRKPKDLSGGQRQRVAMGRAIVRRPQVFLMDEPLSNLDAKLRVQTRNQIAALQRQLGTTTIYVTHDQVEAMTMGDRVAVLCDGVLQQCAPPRELYRDPDNVFVAGFIGSPAMNLFTLPIADSAVTLGDWPMGIPREIATGAAEIVVGIRPEHFEVGTVGVEIEVDVVEELGADAYLYGRISGAGQLAGQSIVARTDGRQPPERGAGCVCTPTRSTALLRSRRPSDCLTSVCRIRVTTHDAAIVAPVSTQRVDLVCEGGGVRGSDWSVRWTRWARPATGFPVSQGPAPVRSSRHWSPRCRLRGTADTSFRDHAQHRLLEVPRPQPYRTRAVDRRGALAADVGWRVSGNPSGTAAHRFARGPGRAHFRRLAYRRRAGTIRLVAGGHRE
ncbi:hypothetical protein NIIDMKKI_31590 [Mycobacterium kansasii]|uniref:Trehalose import ATP-binding protein SugC n=1 Tax=Mycobacterium kansasii TaxID=1768 RepID=A0A7G1ICC4_MYCKA|nr:hypothetical protein NIIDMKKI_31590 [Mycobacterium kansasii]